MGHGGRWILDSLKVNNLVILRNKCMFLVLVKLKMECTKTQQRTDAFLYFVTFQTGAVHTDYYHDSDLTIGTVLNVWGRKFRICDCDEFTKEYYKSKYGLRKLHVYPASLLYLKIC